MGRRMAILGRSVLLKLKQGRGVLPALRSAGESVDLKTIVVIKVFLTDSRASSGRAQTLVSTSPGKKSSRKLQHKAEISLSHGNVSTGLTY